MAQHEATLAQMRIIDFASDLFDLSWKQASAENAINFEVSPEDVDDLKKYMSIHGYNRFRIYNESTIKGNYDISFVK